MAERIQLRRTAGWRKPDGAVVVARPTKWGNPATIDSLQVVAVHNHPDRAQTFSSRPPTMADVIEWYRDALRDGDLGITVDEVRRELAGKDLACWCPVGADCHADVLLRVAAGGQP